MVLYQTTVKWFCTKQQLNGRFVAALEKGGSPENVHVLISPINLAFLLTFHVFGSECYHSSLFQILFLFLLLITQYFKSCEKLKNMSENFILTHSLFDMRIFSVSQMLR